MPVTLTGMENVVPIAEARDRRMSRIAERAGMHPALRWQARGDGRAHRRVPGGRTACGEAGPLILADRDAPWCGVCHPHWARVAAR